MCKDILWTLAALVINGFLTVFLAIYFCICCIRSSRRKILRNNEPVSAENEIGIADIRNRIKNKFLGCFKDSEKNSNYEKNVNLCLTVVMMGMRFSRKFFLCFLKNWGKAVKYSLMSCGNFMSLIIRLWLGFGIYS